MLHLDLDHFGEIERPTRPARLPVVFTAEEARRLLAALQRAGRRTAKPESVADLRREILAEAGR